MDFPPELRLLLIGRDLAPVRIGESGAAVWQCTQPGHADWYLKAASRAVRIALDREAACMRWMRSVGVPAPTVLDCCQAAEDEFLLTEAVAGAPASDSRWRDAATQVATALGQGLARLHSTDATTCPFDRRIARQLDEARARLAAGDVRQDDFDAARLGRDAGDLFAELLSLVPSREDLVLVHGDFCIPNVLLTQEDDALHVTGLVDCGRAGIGDRHQDLALAIRSLTYNFDADTIAPFLDAYGGPPIAPRVLEFFTILDEFF